MLQENHFYILVMILITGCPTKHNSNKDDLKVVFEEFICDIQSSTYFNMNDFWNILDKIFLSWHFQNVGCLFCAVNITGDNKIKLKLS